MSFCDLVRDPVSVADVLSRVGHHGAGAVDLFIGVVRDHNDGRAVTELHYSAYESMARRTMQRIADGVEAEFPGVRVAAIHRLGALHVGDAAVVCAASAVHRGEAFAACRALIDRIKADVPIWKKEHGPDGVAWVGWVDARCRGDAHRHPAPPER